MNQNVVKPAGIIAAIAAVTIGAWALAGATSNNESDATAGNGPGNGQMPGGMTPPGASGYGAAGGPPGGGPGNMTEVTGDDAEKAESAALKEVSGSVERVIQIPDQDVYLVMVVKSDDSRVMVEVSSDFKSAVVREGGPGQGGPGQGGPPPGADGQIPNNGSSVDPNSGSAN